MNAQTKFYTFNFAWYASMGVLEAYAHMYQHMRFLLLHHIGE